MAIYYALLDCSCYLRLTSDQPWQPISCAGTNTVRLQITSIRKTQPCNQPSSPGSSLSLVLSPWRHWYWPKPLCVILGHAWGYVLWSAAGAISLYINIVLWFMEKEYVYPSRGALAYYSYYWGFFVYWGILAVAYSALRLSGIQL